MNFTTMANAIMLVYFAPLFSAVIAHFFMKERLRLLAIALIVFAILGFAMMLEFKLDLQGDKKRVLGVSFAVLAMLCYSGFMLVNRKISDHVFTSTFYQLLVGGTILVPVVLYSSSAITMQQSLLLAGVGFFPGFLGILLAVVALRHLNTASFGTLAYFEPLSVVLFGWLIFGEKLSGLQMGGCFIILFSGIIKVIADTKTEKTQLA
jgi:drug/metabolite transporter (DMT)-like permease